MSSTVLPDSKKLGSVGLAPAHPSSSQLSPLSFPLDLPVMESQARMCLEEDGHLIIDYEGSNIHEVYDDILKLKLHSVQLQGTEQLFLNIGRFEIHQANLQKNLHCVRIYF